VACSPGEDGTLLEVSPDLTTARKTEGYDKKKVRQTDDRSKARLGATEADKPGTVVTAEAPSQPSSSQEMRPSAEKASDKASKESPNEGAAEPKPPSADVEKTKPTSNAQKDAA